MNICEYLKEHPELPYKIVGGIYIQTDKLYLNNNNISSIDGFIQTAQLDLSNNKIITLTKAIMKSPVHRYVDMDYIGVKEFDNKGRVIGEHRFVGLLTSMPTPAMLIVFLLFAKKLKRY